MGNYAELRDVEDEWDQPIPQSMGAHVDLQIDKAEALLLAEVPDLAARIANDRLPNVTTATVKGVVVGMVVRKLLNPKGQRSGTRGPFSFTLDSTVAAGRLFLSREDRKILGLRRGARSIPMGDDTLADLFTSPPRTQL